MLIKKSWNLISWCPYLTTVIQKVTVLSFLGCLFASKNQSIPAINLKGTADQRILQSSKRNLAKPEHTVPKEESLRGWDSHLTTPMQIEKVLYCWSKNLAIWLADNIWAQNSTKIFLLYMGSGKKKYTI